MVEPLLTVENLVAGYGRLEILHGVSLSVEAGSVTGIIGPNGSGKSTLLKTIAGFLTPQRGQIRFRGTDITGLTPHEILRHGVMFMPQGQRIFPRLTVQENLQMGGYSLAQSTEVNQRMRSVFRLFPILQEKAHQLAGELSGGQQAMVSFGMAMMSHPRLILLDEPSAGLAPRIIQTVFERIAELNQGEGMTFLIVEQNIRKIMEVADTIYILDKGENVFSGRPEEMRSREELMALYLHL